MVIGSEYDSRNCGRFKILHYTNAFKVLIQFIQTGFIKEVRSEHIRSGYIKDPYFPTVCGKGYLGEGRYVCSINKVITVEYAAWSKMLQRCYASYVHINYPTYKECSVVDSWLNFQNFAEWFTKQNYTNKELDKDILVTGNKLYSPETCSLVTKANNIEKAFAKNYIFLNPLGEKVEIYNLAKFAKEHNLGRELMGKVYRGERSHHKQWRKYVE